MRIGWRANGPVENVVIRRLGREIDQLGPNPIPEATRQCGWPIDFAGTLLACNYM